MDKIKYDILIDMKIYNNYIKTKYLKKGLFNIEITNEISPLIFFF